MIPLTAVARDHHTMPGEVAWIFAMAEPGLVVYTHLVNFSAPGIPVVDSQEPVETTRTAYDGLLVVGHALMDIEVGDAIVVSDRIG